jgi:hypothetical protein
MSGGKKLSTRLEQLPPYFCSRQSFLTYLCSVWDKSLSQTIILALRKPSAKATHMFRKARVDQLVFTMYILKRWAGNFSATSPTKALIF